jgi:nucleoside-diphosphate-sugar epimerase/FAD/FMN-containing dehydrogenase
MKDIVCVTGGSGGIGQALLEQLVDRYEVKALFRARSELTDTWTERGCRAVWGDLSQDAALSELVQGAKFVFHCAALTQGPYRESHAINVDGTRRLAQLAAAHGCHRFVHISSVAVYDGAPGGLVRTEDTVIRERDDMAVYARTKLESEHAVTEIARANRIDYTILRPTCVYGPNVKSFTLAPIALITKGLPAIIGDGQGLMDVVYVDDVAKAIVLAAESPQAGGQVFNIGHETVTFNDFYVHYGQMLNRPVRHLPISLINALQGLLRLVPRGALAQLRQGARFVARMATTTARFPSDKARTLLGYTPEVTLPAGMLKTALWGKRQRLVPSTYFSLETYGSGQIPFTPFAVVHPGTEDDLVQIARISHNEKLPLKAIGSLHSLSRIPETDGICVVLDRYNELVRVDGSLVTVQAGMQLRTLNATLAKLNLALPNLGAITEQTVAGVVSTATHGGSLHFGSLSDQVESLRIVRADGSVIEMNRSHELFPAVGVSLGLLGMISTVTFRCVPAFVLQSRSSVKTAAEVLEKFDAINRNNLYIDMLYFPATDQVAIFSINKPTEGDSLTLEDDKDHFAKKPSRVWNANAVRRLRTLAVKGIAAMLVRNRWLHRKLAEHSVGSSYRSRTGRSDRVLAFGDGGTLGRSPMELLLEGMEVAVPYDRAVVAISSLRRHFVDTGRVPLLPVHIRCSPKSPLWMNPLYQRDVCWLEFWLYPHPESLSRQQVHELLEPFHYRFHWGKQTHVDREYIRRQYERWDDFARLRHAWDPDGLFLNEYLGAFFRERRAPVQ